MPEISYPNLDYIAEIESNSGKNPASRVPNSAGALGTFQLTPIAWKDLQQQFPEKYGNIPFNSGALHPEISREAAQDTINVAIRRLQVFGLPITEENILAVYNAGIGTVKNAAGDISRYPLETQNYIKKYKSLKSNGSRIRKLR